MRPPRRPRLSPWRRYGAGLGLVVAGAGALTLAGFPAWVGWLWAVGVTGAVLWDTWEE